MCADHFLVLQLDARLGRGGGLLESIPIEQDPPPGGEGGSVPGLSRDG